MSKDKGRKRVALYARVSTRDQTLEPRLHRLWEWTKARSWADDVVDSARQVSRIRSVRSRIIGVRRGTS